LRYTDGRVHPEQTGLSERRFKPDADTVGAEFETISKSSWGFLETLIS
jgi:hypothetical protein